MADPARNLNDEASELDGPAFDEAGVDLTQIEWVLSMTPAERLRVLYESAASLARLRSDGDSD